MPLFVERYGTLASTGAVTREVLRLLREQKFCPHLEIETYTWEWLPPDLKRELLDSLTAEYLWVLEAMGDKSCQLPAFSFQQKQRHRGERLYLGGHRKSWWGGPPCPPPARAARDGRPTYSGKSRST